MQMIVLPILLTPCFLTATAVVSTTNLNSYSTTGKYVTYIHMPTDDCFANTVDFGW